MIGRTACNRVLNQAATSKVCQNVRHNSSQSKYKFDKKLERPDFQRGTKKRGALLLVFPIATFGLGCWQFKRLGWKVALIENLEARASAKPIPLPEDHSDMTEYEFQRISVSGRFDHSQEILMGPRSKYEKDAPQKPLFGGNSDHIGWHVVTPFELKDSGERIMVSRGWIPQNQMHKETRLEGQIEGDTTVTGHVRLTDTDEDEAWKKFYQKRNLRVMSDQLNTLPVFLEATASSSVPGGPVGGQTRITMRNEHMQYAVTWWGLSIVTTLMWISKFIIK